MAPKIAIVYYSMYGHIKQLADAELKGIQEAGGDAKLFQYVQFPIYSPRCCAGAPQAVQK
jgi:multimeric flavodoxin WrbA